MDDCGLHLGLSPPGPGQRLQVRLPSRFRRSALRERRGRVRQRAVPQRRALPGRGERLPVPVSARLLWESLPGERRRLRPEQGWVWTPNQHLSSARSWTSITASTLRVRTEGGASTWRPTTPVDVPRTTKAGTARC